MQQIAREREEDRDAKITAAEESSQQARGQHGPGQEGRVREHHQGNGEGAQTVQCGVVVGEHVTGGRGAAHRGSIRTRARRSRALSQGAYSLVASAELARR